jgi:Carboxypeptidase regulatory-like domain
MSSSTNQPDTNRSSEPSAGNPSPGRASTNIWVAVIGAAATITAGYLTYLATRKHEPAPLGTIFSGRVWNEDSRPVLDAKVSIAEDQNVPQTTKTDADGIFHIQLSPTTQSLRITVYADGYDAVTKDANPHRTGPEDISIYHHKNGMADKTELIKVVSEFEQRLSDVDEYQRQLVPLENSELDSRQGLSVLIWRAWYGSSDYANAVPEFKGIRWKGLLVKLRELGVTEKYHDAEKAITEIEEGDIPGRHFTASYLKPRLDILRDYRASVLEPAIR